MSRRAETAYRCGLIEGIILITALAGRNTGPPLMYRYTSYKDTASGGNLVVYAYSYMDMCWSVECELL